MRPFQELRIVEIAGSPAGAYAAKLFADLGAAVLKVEPSGGDPLRREGLQFAGMGTAFGYLNTSKESVELDLSTSSGREQLEKLLQRADAVLESSSPGPLEPASKDNAILGLVRTLISPFGLSGPYSAFSSNAFTDEAIGGHLFLNGEPSREPIRRPGLHAFYQAGTHAFIGTIAALRVRELTGIGQTVEISHFEGFAGLHQHTTSMWTHAGYILRREGNRQPGQWHPVGCYRCKDGFVHLSLPSQAMVEPFLLAAGLSDLLSDPRFADDYARGAHKDEFDAAIQPWLDGHTANEIVSLGQEVLTPVGTVPDMLEVAADAHLAERDYWAAVEGWPGISFPRGPFRVSGHARRTLPAPTAGSGDLSADWQESRPEVSATAGLDRCADGPLTGIRILDLTRVWAGPYAGRLLADMGADVIAVEMPTGRGPRDVPQAAALISHLYPDNLVGERPWNRVAGFNKLFRNRRGITLNLRHPRCRELFTDLVRSSDVVLENYSPRVMEQLGFSDRQLLEINPHLIHVSMPGFGASGPKRNWVAFGPLIEAACGLSSMTGYADSGPYRSGIAWSDPVAGMNAAAGLLVALWDREADLNRAGVQVEVAMIEAMVAFVGEELIAAQVRGEPEPRRGNRNPNAAPQGCYRCAGVDRWIAISVTNDDEWRSLCRVAGLADLAALGFEERMNRHDELDRRITAWTRTRTPRAIMRKLQGAGVIAAVVTDGRDLVEDDQLAEREFWAILDQPDVGPMPYPGNPIHFSRTPVTFRRPAPGLGEHNQEILGGQLGLTQSEMRALTLEGAICDAPPS